MTQIRIGYFADGPWSHHAFDLLAADTSITIKFVCARFDNPDSVLRQKALSYGIPFLTHPKINSDEFLQIVSTLNADLFVSMSFNQIFGERLLNVPPMKTVNCHAGKLPFYRGRNILNWVLINDEKEFGITAHYVDQGIDTGDIIVQETFPISETDDYSTLLARAYPACAGILFKAIKLLQSGSFAVRHQADIHALGMYCTARKHGDERLDWGQSSRDVFNFVRAICRPGPEARTFRGDVEMRINKVAFLANAPHYKSIPGAVIGIEGATLLVKTGDSFVRVLDWSTSERIRIGDRLQ
jgi:methionyl-tRNA formyltransferase